MSNIAVFLDRDGTINEEVEYLKSPADIHLLSGAAEAIKEINQLGLKVIITTNQSAVARGLLTEDQLSLIHSSLTAQLNKQGSRIDAIYYCPHHPDTGNPPYRTECDCRKPKTGMITRAACEHDLDLKKSFIVGDKLSDIQTGINAGMTSILVLTGYGKEELGQSRTRTIHIDYVAERLSDAVRYIRQTVLQQHSVS